MTIEHLDPTDHTPAALFELVSISGMRVFICADVWLQTLDDLDFSLDGGGDFAILPLADAGLREMALVFAHPVNALAPLSEPPFSLELAFARGENTVLMGLAAPSPGGAVAFASVDLGNPVVRDCLAEFASQPCIHLLLVHPRTGALLGDIKLHSPEMLGHIREVLGATADVREMDLSERLLADAELYDTLYGAAGSPDGEGTSFQTPRMKSDPQPRNALCRCGSGVKSKHCCG